MRFADKVEAVKRYFSNTREGRPLYVGLNVTEACNADCDFCGYRRSRRYDERIVHGLPSYLPVLNDLKPIVLSFLGGEPFSRSDLEYLVAEAKHGARVPYVQITTNGSHLSKERYVRLSEAGLDRLNISLDYTGEAHDESRGIPNLYKRIAQFLNDADDADGAKISFNTIVMAGSLQHARDVVQLAERYGHKVTLFPYSPVKNGNASHVISLEVAGARQLFRELKLEYPDTIINPEGTMPGIDAFLKDRRYNSCDAGRSFMWVKPDGTYMGCIDIPDSRATDLEAVRKFADRNKCTDCYLPCRAMSETASRASGSLLGLANLLKHYKGIAA